MVRPILKNWIPQTLIITNPYQTSFLINYILFEKNYNILHLSFQLGLRVQHSTETAPVKVVNNIRTNNDLNNLSVLVLLDLSAAFDTVNHEKLGV